MFCNNEDDWIISKPADKQTNKHMDVVHSVIVLDETIHWFVKVMHTHIFFKYEETVLEWQIKCLVFLFIFMLGKNHSYVFLIRFTMVQE